MSPSGVTFPLRAGNVRMLHEHLLSFLRAAVTITSCPRQDNTDLNYQPLFEFIDINNNNNNNNNNNHDDIYSAVIMTRSLREFTQFIW